MWALARGVTGNARYLRPIRDVVLNSRARAMLKRLPKAPFPRLRVLTGRRRCGGQLLQDGVGFRKTLNQERNHAIEGGGPAVGH